MPPAPSSDHCTPKQQRQATPPAQSTNDNNGCDNATPPAQRTRGQQTTNDDAMPPGQWMNDDAMPPAQQT
ncbi:hypothetical protein K443DRAFT_9672 [Laccaria amethystina LaAM-08-1]|uniref:Uncharacterized protein n=1 Tax=Laccaria amethystina LaAM-08-1 TaxID=1095629 RepID=A0A0C9X8H8_9AGAR|nr:hypothetical protein K443DRAFT_9672 [Laccaria amethystina LaAM-08-1]